MEIDHDDVATQLVYLVAGTDDEVTIHYVAENMKGTHADHPLRASGGHTGMVADLIPYAKQVSAYLTSKVGEQGFPGVFPGVFEYEVTEPLGAWLANNWESAGPTSFNTELEARGTAFFAQ